MRPFCQSIEIAGSIRRRKPEVKDVEIVAVPRWIDGPGEDLFGPPKQYNTLHVWATRQRTVTWIKTGTTLIVPWEIDPKGKYWRGIWPCEMKLDLFLATPENYGLILLIRTGPADWSRRFVTQRSKGGWLPDHLRVEGGTIRDQSGTALATPTEEDAFELAGRQWLPPERRVA
jgi:DNA polymerase/3'-5' exonuclease PolX